MRILVTSGGTKVPIDMVRSITNMSSGTFGSKIALEYLKLGHEVIFLRARDSKSPFTTTIDLCAGYTIGQFSKWVNERAALLKNYSETEFVTFEDYEATLKLWVEKAKPDMVVLAAAVSDYGVLNPVGGKFRSSKELTIELSPLPKVIERVKEWNPNTKLVGFKLLVNSTEDQLKSAIERSMDHNHCDMVVGNDLRDIKNSNHKLLIARRLGEATRYERFSSEGSSPEYLAKMVVQSSMLL